MVEALNELSGRAVPGHALDALRASYLDSNLAAKELSWIKVSGEEWSAQSSYMGVERKPS